MSPLRLLVDTNLLVLLIVGKINRKRIEKFKRTNKYRESDFDLLCDLIAQATETYTVTQVMAETGNLTDLKDHEGEESRALLKQLAASLTEPPIASTEAAQDDSFAALGLTDAAIARVARLHECTVLTDDLDLYLYLQRSDLPVLNFTHYRAQAGTV